MMNLGKTMGWLRSKAIYEWYPGKGARKRKFYSSFINENDLCIDVGAHLGDRSQTFLELGAQVIAVEPQPDFVKYLKRKFQYNSSFNLVPKAISATTGMAKFYISSHHPTLSTLSSKDWQEKMDSATTQTIDFDQELEVETITLDQLAADFRPANFIKIDVEGFELEVLQGLSYQPAMLSIEFLSFDLSLLAKCLDRLETLGYAEFNWSFRETFKWSLNTWTSSKECLKSITTYKSDIFSGDVYTRKSQ